jgi:cob(I)alamin adenosyltransferase
MKFFAKRVAPRFIRLYAKKSPIYTRTGDLGTSSLYNGERKSKGDARFHSLGDVE